MSQDGQTVVTLSKDCTARVWDASTGACRHVLTGAERQLPAPAFGAVGRGLIVLCTCFLGCSGCCPPHAAQAAPSLLTTDTRVPGLVSIRTAGHTDSVLGGCIADAARLLATFGFDDCVRLWALDSGQCINCIKLPDSPQVCRRGCGGLHECAGRWHACVRLRWLVVNGSTAVPSRIALHRTRHSLLMRCVSHAAGGPAVSSPILPAHPTRALRSFGCSWWPCPPTAGRWRWPWPTRPWWC